MKSTGTLTIYPSDKMPHLNEVEGLNYIQCNQHWNKVDFKTQVNNLKCLRMNFPKTLNDY